MNTRLHYRMIGAVTGAALLSGSLLYAWTPVPIKSDHNLFMPGSQPGTAALESASVCDQCHSGINTTTEIGYNWRGTMMSEASRDPLWKACLTVADQDSIWALGNPNAGDLCLRCHTPTGWLGGRSDPANGSALGTNSHPEDFEGVSCAACHRMVDSRNALRQPEVPDETNATAISDAETTYEADYAVLSTNLLFDGSLFFDTNSRLPVYYGDGTLSNYIESASGQYFIDSTRDTRRGPRTSDEVSPKHPFYYSRFHKSEYFCATCHDVSNPALANVLASQNPLLGTNAPERQAAASYYHVERTSSEFLLSAYGQTGGAAASPKMGTTWAANCQDCHMRRVSGQICKQDHTVFTNLVLHDLNGGNSWVLGILASVDGGGPVYDSYNSNILGGVKYINAEVDVSGVQGYGQNLLDGRGRALQMLTNAANLDFVSENSTDATVRIVNNTGHKLISGFPEGRRMWLNVKFYDGQGAVIDEINPYTPLVISTNAQGNDEYVSGGVLTRTRDGLVYEASMLCTLTNEHYTFHEDHTFHFVLATDRYKDNRIPPKGFDIADASARLAVPKWDGTNAPDYFTPQEYAGGYDQVDFAVPASAVAWRASLYYQTTSKEYIEFLRDEIMGTNTTLSSPTFSGETNAYIVQTDPYFSTLKDWGKAIWDLWLHNGGDAPVLMTTLSSPPEIVEPAYGTNSLSFKFFTFTGRTYQVQRLDNLASTNWTNIGSAISGDNTTKQFVDATAGGSAQEFYRVVATGPN
jgi:hypothetical protein